VNRRLGIKDYTPKHLASYIEKYRSGLIKTKEIIVSSIVGDIKGKRVLDIGCGSGVFSNYCYNQGAKVFSLDFSPVMLKFVKQTNPNLNIIQASGEDLCFRNEYFDVILALDVIEHLYKPKQLLKEISRTLKRNGTTLLITPNTRVFPASKLFSLIYSRILYMIFKSLPRARARTHKCMHVKEYSADEMEHFLRHAYFRILTYDTFSSVPLFNIADKLMSMFFRGPLKKYKWNSVYFYVEKGGRRDKVDVNFVQKRKQKNYLLKAKS